MELAGGAFGRWALAKRKGEHEKIKNKLRGKGKT